MGGGMGDYVQAEERQRQEGAGCCGLTHSREREGARKRKGKREGGEERREGKREGTEGGRNKGIVVGGKERDSSWIHLLHKVNRTLHKTINKQGRAV